MIHSIPPLTPAYPLMSPDPLEPKCGHKRPCPLLLALCTSKSKFGIASKKVFIAIKLSLKGKVIPVFINTCNAYTFTEIRSELGYSQGLGCAKYSSDVLIFMSDINLRCCVILSILFLSSNHTLSPTPTLTTPEQNQPLTVTPHSSV